MPDQLQNVFIQLIRSGLFGESITLPNDVDWQAIYKIACRHHLVNLVAEGLTYANVSTSEPCFQPFYTYGCNELVHSEKQRFELKTIFQVFDRQGIDYIPLKGTVLKELYPAPELRSMSDADILIRFEQYDRIRPLMLELGYVPQEENEYDLVWDKPQALHVELHKRLIPTYVEDYTAIGTGWENAVRVSETSGRHMMSAEDEYVFLFVHLAKHYRHGGVGLKQMTDLYVYSKAHPDMDDTCITRKLAEMSLDVFHRNIRETLTTWFEGESATEKTDFITDVIFKSGAFGTREQTALSGAVKKAEKNTDISYCRIRFNAFWQALFLPYADMCEKYPFLRRVPILLPVMWVYRWIVSLIWKRRKITAAVKTVQDLTPERIETHRQSLQYVGLEFSFEE